MTQTAEAVALPAPLETGEQPVMNYVVAAPPVERSASDADDTAAQNGRRCVQCDAALPAAAHPRRKYCDETCKRAAQRERRREAALAG